MKLFQPIKTLSLSLVLHVINLLLARHANLLQIRLLRITSMTESSNITTVITGKSGSELCRGLLAILSSSSPCCLLSPLLVRQMLLASYKIDYIIL
jgi:hypothetical protein